VRSPKLRRPGTAGTDIHETALRMLARRALSVAEITERLEDREFPPAAVREEVRRLERAGLLDDLAVARAVGRAQLRVGRGRRAIIAALRRRKLPAETATRVLEELVEVDESAALALAFQRVTAKHRFWRRLPDERRKVVRYLLARGFGFDEVRRAMRENGRDEPHGRKTDDAGDPSGVS
jgi:regulatory protein